MGVSRVMGFNFKEGELEELTKMAEARKEIEKNREKKAKEVETLEDRSHLKEVEMTDDELRTRLKGMLSGMTKLHLSILKMGQREGWPLCIEVPVRFDVKKVEWYVPDMLQTDTYKTCLDLTGLNLLRVEDDALDPSNQVWKFDMRPGMFYNIFVKYLEGDF